MKWIFALLFIFAAIGTALAASWETTALRTTNGGLIRVGMPSQEALKELGRTHGSAASADKKRKHKEVLTYRGEDGLYTISLAGGRVVRIVVTPDRD